VSVSKINFSPLERCQFPSDGVSVNVIGLSCFVRRHTGNYGIYPLLTRDSKILTSILVTSYKADSHSTFWASFDQIAIHPAQTYGGATGAVNQRDYFFVNPTD